MTEVDPEARNCTPACRPSDTARHKPTSQSRMRILLQSVSLVKTEAIVRWPYLFPAAPEFPLMPSVHAGEGCPMTTPVRGSINAAAKIPLAATAMTTKRAPKPQVA